MRLIINDCGGVANTITQCIGYHGMSAYSVLAGRHSPYTAVMEVYQLCGRMREHAYPTLPQRGVGKLSRHGVEQDAGNVRHRDMGGVI